MSLLESKKEILAHGNATRIFTPSIAASRNPEAEPPSITYSLRTIEFPDTGEQVYVFELHDPFSGQPLSDFIQEMSKNKPLGIGGSVDDLLLPRRVKIIQHYRSKLPPGEDIKQESERLDEIHRSDPVIGPTYTLLTQGTDSKRQTSKPELPAIMRALADSPTTRARTPSGYNTNRIYPVIAVGINKDGNIRLVTRPDLDNHNFSLTHGSHASIALGHVVLAHYNPDITSLWPRGMHLAEGRQGQVVREVQLIVLANLPTSQEAFTKGHFLRQLLRENGIISENTTEES